MANEIRPRYECTQSELYAICTLGWNRCKTAQATIVASFPEYTVAYIDGKLADIVAVQNTPDFQARNLITETDRILLGQLAVPAIANWDLLERYIIRSFQTNKPLIKPNVEAAGKPYYEASTRENPNWEDLKQMLINGKTYITDHAATTLAPVMPVGFPVDYATAQTDFVNKYNTFTVDTVAAPGDTSIKITANNNLYDALMLMLGDLFTVTPAATQNQISFKYLKSVISSPGPAGLKGTLTDAITGNPLAGVLLRLTPGNIETTSGPDGKYDFGNFASHKYLLEMFLDDYQTRSENITIYAGVTSTKNYTLTPGGDTLTTIIRQGDLNMGVITRIDTDGFTTSPTTNVVFEATTNTFRIYAAVNVTDLPGAVFIDIVPGSPVTLTPAQIETLLGLNGAKPNLMIQNIGAGIGHWKATFNNVIEE